jgi:hypothetical protein
VQGRDFAFHPGEIVDLPMYDEQKRIPRGLDTRIPEETGPA